MVARPLREHWIETPRRSAASTWLSSVSPMRCRSKVSGSLAGPSSSATSAAMMARSPRFGPDADAAQARRVDNQLLAVLAVVDDAGRHQPLAVGVELMRQRDRLRQSVAATGTTSSAPTWVAAALVRQALAARVDARGEDRDRERRGQRQDDEAGLTTSADRPGGDESGDPAPPRRPTRPPPGEHHRRGARDQTGRGSEQQRQQRHRTTAGRSAPSP